MRLAPRRPRVTPQTGPITNRGAITIATDGQFYGAGTFNNEGTIVAKNRVIDG